MASLKTLRLKKLENLNAIKEIVEGRTYYVESNNTLYRDVLSTRVAVGKVYFAPKGMAKLDEKKTLTLSNALVISNEKDVDSDTPVYRIGMYDENGEYVDLSARSLIKDARLDDNNFLVLTFEDGTTTSVHLNTLLTGVVKKVNDKTPDSSGAVSLSYDDVIGLQGELDKKATLTHGHETDDVTGLQSALNNKADKIHNHESSDITDAVNIDVVPLTTLDGNLQINRITNLQTELNKTIEDIKVNGTSLTKTNKSVDIPIPPTPTLENIEGLLPVSKGGTGRPTLTKDRVLVGDGTNKVKLVEQINISQIDIPKTQIPGLQDELDGLASDITTNTGNITSLKTRVGTAEGSIDSLQSGLGTAQTNISSLNTRVGTAESNITTLDGKVTTNTSNILSLTTRVGTNEDDIEGIQTELSNQINIEQVPIVKGMFDDNYFKGVQLDETYFKITFTRRDGTTAVIDLPLESVVVNGSYDTENKKIVLTLQNGNTIEFSVADLVTGLVSIPDVAKGETSNKTLGTTSTFKVLHISTSGTITEKTMKLNITANDVLGVNLVADKVLVGDGSNKIKLVDQIPISAWAMKSNLDPNDVPSIPISRVTNLQIQLNSKQDSIGYTPENITNKKTSWSTTVSNTNYPSEKLVKDSLDSKVDKEVNKGLSTHDFTTELKNRLTGIEPNAQVNKIESISLDSEVLPISSNKRVSIPTTPIYAWAMAENKPTYNYSEITGKPTIPTIPDIELSTTGTAGVITNIVVDGTNKHYLNITQRSRSGIDSRTIFPTNWTNVGSKPTTLTGYGITLSGDVSNTINDITISDNAITTAKIANNAVTNAKILNSTIALTKLANIGSQTVLGNATSSTGAVTTIPLINIDGLGFAKTSVLSNYATTTALTSGLAGKAPLSHGHTISDVSGLQSALNNKAPTGHLHNYDDIKTGDMSFNGVYFKRYLGKGNSTPRYADIPTADRHKHRFWRISFPSGVNFWGKIKITLYGGYSSFNASGSMAKEINVNFNGSSMYSNVGSYTELSGYVEKDFRISEAIWNADTSQWEFLVYSDKLSGNNSPSILIEGWAVGSNYENAFNGLIFTPTPELRADTTYDNVKGNALGQTLTKNWSDLPTFQSPYGFDVLTDDMISDWAKAPTKPSYDLGEIAETSTYKRVSQSEKNTWNAKQSALGFTPENIANKKTSWSSTVSNTNYPSEKLVKNSLDSKVDKVSGKGLSTNDFTTTEKNKLSGIQTGAQVNKIESINLGSEELTISDKSVSIPTTPISAWAMAGNKPSYDLGEIAETSTYKRVSQSEKNTWNSKVNDNEVVRATTENKNILGTTQSVFNISEKKVWFNKGALFYGTAQNAGLVTRGVSGVKTDGSAKDHLYINYDGNNTLSRQLVLGAGSTGTNRGNGIYDYSAVRGDAFIAYLTNTLSSYEKIANKKTSIRDSGADNTSYVSELGVKNYVDTKLSAKQDKLTLDSGQVLGRYSTGTSNVQPITLGSNLTLSTGGVLSATNTVYTHPNSGVAAGTYRSVTVNSQGHVTTGTNPTTLTGYGISLAGDVTNTNNTITIGPKKVTLSKIQDIATGKVLGRTTSGTGEVQALDTIDIGNIAVSNWTQVWSGSVNLNSYRSGWYTATVPSNSYIGKRIAIEVQYGSGTTYTSKIIFGVLGSSSATGADPSVSKGIGWNYFDGTYLRVKTLFTYTSTSNSSAIYVGNLKTLFGKFTGTTIEWSTSYSETLYMKKIWVIE